MFSSTQVALERNYAKLLHRTSKGPAEAACERVTLSHGTRGGPLSEAALQLRECDWQHQLQAL